MGKCYNGIWLCGYIFHFALTQERTELLLEGPLEDKIVGEPDELDGAILGQIFGGISDIELGPEGYLYVISIGQGKLFRLSRMSGPRDSAPTLTKSVKSK
jgi:hypothetical protein